MMQGKENLQVTAGYKAIRVSFGIPSKVEVTVVAVVTSVPVMHWAAAGIAAPRTRREMALMRRAVLNMIVMIVE